MLRSSWSNGCSSELFIVANTLKSPAHKKVSDVLKCVEITKIEVNLGDYLVQPSIPVRVSCISQAIDLPHLGDIEILCVAANFKNKQCIVCTFYISLNLFYIILLFRQLVWQLCATVLRLQIFHIRLIQGFLICNSNYGLNFSTRKLVENCPLHDFCFSSTANNFFFQSSNNRTTTVVILYVDRSEKTSNSTVKQTAL